MTRYPVTVICSRCSQYSRATGLAVDGLGGMDLILRCPFCGTESKVETTDEELKLNVQKYDIECSLSPEAFDPETFDLAAAIAPPILM